MQKSLFALAVSLLIVSTVGMNIESMDSTSSLRVNADKPATVPFVDIQKYSGLWYEQAVIQFYFERGCTKTTANYSLNADGKSIRIDNSCVRNGKII